MTTGKKADGAAARWVPFAYGFRPFFLAAGCFALIALAVWVWLFESGAIALGRLPAHLWHAHEMLFGFVVAAIAGFMLTAVPGWTGARGFAGRPLILLCCVWLAGRIAMVASGSMSWAAVAVCELAFLPALAVIIAPSLLRTADRNRALLIVLAILWVTDAAFVYGIATGNTGIAVTALHSALNVVLLLITVIGGRIVPAFTANALRNRGVQVEVRVRKGIERTVVVAMIAYMAVDAVAPNHPLTALVAGLASGAHFWRMTGWQGVRTFAEPIVWVLHAGYAWLPIGLGLKAVFLLISPAWAAHWLHALSVGAAATMILGVMTRASLGHTGRALIVANPVAWAYALLLAATAVRVFGPAMLPNHYRAVILASSSLWLAAFSLFVIVYTPVLTRPRADGKPG